MKDRICERCGDTYNPDSYTAKYCPRCSPLMMQEKARERSRRYLERQKRIRREAREQRRIDHGEW